MRVYLVSLVIMTSLVLITTGCGKTTEQTKMERDLNAKVIVLQNDVTSNLAGFTDLQAKLDATLKTHKDLVKKYGKKMKGHTADDIAAAKQGLDGAKSEAETAFKALTTYDAKMDHEQAMKKLNQNRESLIKIKDVVAGAVSASNAAIADHENLKSKLMAKAPAKANKKVAKKISSKKKIAHK